MRLDLHTHLHEATLVSDPTIENVREIIARVKERGLDGIAITDHYNYGMDYAYKVKEIVDRYFDSEILIIPGREIERPLVDVVELFLPCGVTFRFLAHPGFPFNDFTRDLDDLHGIEVGNPLHDQVMNKPRIKEVAEKHDLILLTNSDAHRLSDIGQYYNEISIEELCNRANR